MAASDILDPETVEALRAYERDGILTLAELTDIYLGDVTNRYTAIEQAIQTADSDSLQRAAHALKSAAANVGAFGMRDICQQLETLGKSGTAAGTEILLKKLTTEIPRVENALKDLSNKT